MMLYLEPMFVPSNMDNNSAVDEEKFELLTRSLSIPAVRAIAKFVRSITSME